MLLNLLPPLTTSLRSLVLKTTSYRLRLKRGPHFASAPLITRIPPSCFTGKRTNAAGAVSESITACCFTIMTTKTPPPLATGNSKKRQRATPRPLEVHVVEDHADVLEHLYDSIGVSGREGRGGGATCLHLTYTHPPATQAKRTPFSKLDWIHFDSHPDLTLPPALSASTVRDPQALYEVLDESEGGNAEFILPAVFAGHVTRVTWVRPPWARQLPDGLHRFHVGVEKASACLRVTLPAVYYLDEGLHCSLQEMDTDSAAALELRVCPVEDSETLLPKRPAAEGSGGWLLDICLDYYSTENPFLEAVETVAGGREARAAVCNYFEAPRFRQENLGEMSPEVVKREVRTWMG